MISVDDALAAISVAVTPTGSERVNTTDALGRVLAADVATPTALPLFDQSAVDGYAVRYDDIAATPVTLPLDGMVQAGAHDAPPTLAPGHAARIFTGGLLPIGCDTVVRQEETKAGDGVVEIVSPIPFGADLRRAGEELAAGAQVAVAGSPITAGLLGALAFAGVASVDVRVAPKAQVFVTGDEVAPLGATLRLGQVPDANGPLVMAHMDRWGVDATPGHLFDDRDAVKAALDEALTNNQLVITTGGVSVGDFDFIPSVSEELGAERVLWKVAQKPGMPLYVAKRGDCLLIGLPGNPGAVLVNLHIYVRHVIDLMLGRQASRWLAAAPPAGVHRETNKTFWLRARAVIGDDGELSLHELKGQASHMLANLAVADALVRIPGKDTGEMPATVRWTRLTD